MVANRTDEEQVEALQNWLKENGRSAITGIVIGLIILFGWNMWQDHQQVKKLGASTLYQQILEAEKEKKPEQIESLAAGLNDRYGSSAYAVFGNLFAAKTKANAGDLPAAKAALERAIKSQGGDPSIRHIARIRLLQLMLASGENEAVLQIVAEVKPANMGAFEADYEAVKGNAYYALDRPAEARTAYQKALRLGRQSALLQIMIDDLTPSEIQQSVAKPAQPPTKSSSAPASAEGPAAKEPVPTSPKEKSAGDKKAASGSEKTPATAMKSSQATPADGAEQTPESAQ